MVIKTIIKISSLAVLLLFGCFVLTAQDHATGKIRAYEIWIKQVDSEAVTRGILYEIADSSLFLVPSLRSDQILEFRADEIDLLKVRKQGGIINGAYTGFLIGFAPGAVVGYFLGQDDWFFGGIFVLGFGAVGGLVGMGVGALSGSMKDRIPVRASQENFEKYIGSLQHYSYLDEQPRHPVFIHRCYFSLSMGFSHAGGEFANNLTVSNYPGMQMSGLTGRLEIGYFFSKNLGIHYTSRTFSSWESDIIMGWSYNSEMLGPVFSLPVSDRFRFDFIPSLGISSLSLYHIDDELIAGNGLGLSLAGRMAYVKSKRWNIQANASYISSKHKYDKGTIVKPSAFDLSFGVDYKFGKKSL